MRRENKNRRNEGRTVEVKGDETERGMEPSFCFSALIESTKQNAKKEEVVLRKCKRFAFAKKCDQKYEEKKFHLTKDLIQFMFVSVYESTRQDWNHNKGRKSL